MTKVLCVCGNIKARNVPCEKCNAGKPTQHAKTTKERGYDWAWQQFSQRVRQEQPLCEDCLEAGRYSPSREVHHKVKIAAAPHLRLVRSNVMALCKECHRVRTERGE